MLTTHSDKHNVPGGFCLKVSPRPHEPPLWQSDVVVLLLLAPARYSLLLHVLARLPISLLARCLTGMLWLRAAHGIHAHLLRSLAQG